MTKYYTLADIAQMAGVSHMTVSRAINGTGTVKPETYERIMKICRETGFMPNVSARNLAARKNNIIGVMVPDISTVFNSEVVSHIERFAYQKGFHTLISSSFNNYEREEEILATFAGYHVCGVMATGAGKDSVGTLLQYANRIPMCCLGHNSPTEGVSWVRADELKSGRMATEYLIGLGHKHFTFVGGMSIYPGHDLRYEGFRTTLEENGIFDYQRFRLEDGTNGYETGKAYFKKGLDATAIVAVNSKFALGFMQAAYEFGLNAPKDFSLISFNGESYPALPQISMTTVTQPIDEFSENAFDILMKNIEADGDIEPIQSTVQPVLNIRHSCREL